MQQLKIDNISLHYGKHTAIKNVSLSLKKGEIACLLGPSGCGKTSLQRLIAGFEMLSEGSIQLAGRRVSEGQYSLAPEHRKIGMVFQDFALFPHLTVEQNILFGLRKKSKQEKQACLYELLDLIDLQGLEKRFPHQLSGGQQQRVALARAIAPSPDILLLDEPFSSLDTTLRTSLAKDVRNLLKQRKITAILATHHQQEAFAIADTIGIMQTGELVQWSSPYDTYHQPNSRFVAEFIGEGQMIQAEVDPQGGLICALGKLGENKTWHADKTHSVLVRPDDLYYDSESETRYTILDKLFRGADYLYQLQISDEQHVLCEVPSHINMAIGEQLPVITDFKHVVVFSD